MHEEDDTAEVDGRAHDRCDRDRAGALRADERPPDVDGLREDGEADDHDDEPELAVDRQHRDDGGHHHVRDEPERDAEADDVPEPVRRRPRLTGDRTCAHQLQPGVRQEDEVGADHEADRHRAEVGGTELARHPHERQQPERRRDDLADARGCRTPATTGASVPVLIASPAAHLEERRHRPEERSGRRRTPHPFVRGLRTPARR